MTDIKQYVRMRYSKGGDEEAVNPGAMYIRAMKELSKQINERLVNNDVEMATVLMKVKKEVWLNYHAEMDFIEELKQEAKWEEMDLKYGEGWGTNEDS